MTEFTKDQLSDVSAFIAQVRERAPFNRQELAGCYESWYRRAGSWEAIYGFAQADSHMAVWWYQYRHKPGAKEWRPAYIVRALIAAAERDYVEPERIKPNDAVLRATLNDKKKARLVFMRKHGVATFYQKVNPILTARRRGGVKALFEAPATAETRAYVEILAGIASETA